MVDDAPINCEIQPISIQIDLHINRYIEQYDGGFLGMYGGLWIWFKKWSGIDTSGVVLLKETNAKMILTIFFSGNFRKHACHLLIYRPDTHPTKVGFILTRKGDKQRPIFFSWWRMHHWPQTSKFRVKIREKKEDRKLKRTIKQSEILRKSTWSFWHEEMEIYSLEDNWEFLWDNSRRVTHHIC